MSLYDDFEEEAARRRRIDPLESLEAEQKRLQKRFDDHRQGLSRNSRKTVFWGAVGGAAMLADWTFLGGLGTVLAGLNSLGVVAYGGMMLSVGKELKQVKSKINDMREERFEAELRHPELRSGALKADFSPAAQRRVAELEEQLKGLAKKLDDLEGPKKIDKPKFKPPENL